ncbi:MAG: hypothetical protein ACRD94_07780 [Nitrosopumilaceae archaeon]
MKGIKTTKEINAEIGWTGNEFDNILQGLVKIDQTGDTVLLGKAIESMNKMWKDIDEVMSPLWFNKELAKLWREHLKEKETTKS